jgi:ectoine hydroxylase-related dioxygenase (phytanoyl-CoA dioxygenase family)
MLNAKQIWLIIILIFIVLLIIKLFFYSDIIEEYPEKYTLHNDGIQLFKNVLNKNEIVDIIEKCNNENYIDAKLLLLKHPKILNLIHSTTSNQYIFQDYVWIIKKSVVHTCHRDNNGDFFNENQKHPSYTMLIYLEDMEKCLGIIPNSHKDLNSYNVNLFENVVNIPCKKGDVILFNANLIHVGCINKKDDNLRIQLKVSHKDDIDKLQYYQKFNKILNKDNNLPVFLRKGQRQFSCMFPFMSNLTQNENIRTARGSTDGVEIGLPQKTFSYLFYGNPDFYDLPNAF